MKQRFFRPGTVLLLCLLAGGCAYPERYFEPSARTVRQSQQAEAILAPLPAMEPPPPAALRPPEGAPLELTVEEAVLHALANNRDLQVNKLEPVISAAAQESARGRFDPELFAELELGRERIEETARSTGESFSVEGTQRQALLGIRQELPFGTELELGLSQERIDSNRAPEQSSARLGLELTQPLLQGLGSEVTLAEVRQAGLETLASRHELRGFVESILAETEIAYWNFVLAREEIAIFARSLKVAQQQRDAIELRIEVGVLAPIEAAAARAEVALRQQALIDAESLLEERRLRLLKLLGFGHGESYGRQILAGSDPRIEPVPVSDLDTRLALAEQLRSDLNEARLRLATRRLETVLTRNGILPRLDLFINLGRSGFAQSFGESFREINGPAYDITAGVRFSHLLGNRQAHGQDLQARASRRQALESVRNLLDLVRLDVRLAANEVERSARQIVASQATRVLQEATVRAEMDRFEVGAGTALLVAQAQRDLLESRIAEVEAVVQYRIALVNLHRAEGSLLERKGIRLGLEMPAQP